MKKIERIEEILNTWKENKGIGRVILPPSFGKQPIALTAITMFLKKNPDKEVSIISNNLSSRYQWKQWLDGEGLSNRCSSYTISYILNNKSKFPKLPMIILDDLDSEKLLSDLCKVPHKFILFLSSCYNESKFSKLVPVIDIISKGFAIENNWIPQYKEYKVILDVDDIEEYKRHNSKFVGYMKCFNYDLPLALKCVKSGETREEIAKLKRFDIKTVNACTFGANKELKWRKNFVFNHPKKLEIAKKILEYNSSKACIIFSPTIEIANTFEGIQYNSKLTDRGKLNVLNSINGFLLDTTISAVNDVSEEIKAKFDVEVILSNTSSNHLKENRLRLIKDEGKIFTLVLKGTMEEAWFKHSTLDNDYITISEKMLQRVLEGKEILEERIEGPEMLYNY